MTNLQDKLIRLLGETVPGYWEKGCDKCRHGQHESIGQPCLIWDCSGWITRYQVDFKTRLFQLFDKRENASYENRFVYRDTKRLLFHIYRMGLRKPLRGSLEREYQFAREMDFANKVVDESIFDMLLSFEKPWFVRWLDERTTWLDKRVATR